MTVSDEQFAALTARVTALETAAKPQPPVSDSLLAKFADDVVRKPPSTWKGRPIEGLKYSELTPAECGDLAGFFDWKAAKGRAENPPRLDNAGKAWYLRDELHARVLHAMALKAPPF
jgi:hypothetical protein